MAVPARVVQPRGGTVRETLNRNIALRGGGLAGLKKKIELAINAKQQLLLRMERRTLADPAVHRVVALSGYVVRQLREHHAYPDDRITVIPNAAVMPPVHDAQHDAWRHAIRRGFGVADDEVAYLFAAQNPRAQGVRHAARRAGDGSAARGAGCGAARRQLRLPRAQADRRGGPAQRRPRRSGRRRGCRELYAAADVTVLPTWYDPSSKVVLESLMMHTPAISTAYNGASDFILPDDGPPRGAVIDDPGDPAAPADAMQRLADPGFRAACAAVCDGMSDTLSMQRHVDALEARACATRHRTFSAAIGRGA